MCRLSGSNPVLVQVAPGPEPAQCKAEASTHHDRAPQTPPLALPDGDHKEELDEESDPVDRAEDPDEIRPVQEPVHHHGGKEHQVSDRLEGRDGAECASGAANIWSLD